MSNLELRRAFASMQNIHNKLNSRSSLTPEQIKENKIKELKDNMINAKNRVENSPGELEKAEKDYYLAAHGSTYYSTIKRNRYEKEAQRQVSAWNKELINPSMDSIENSIHFYNSQRNYAKNVEDVYNNYSNKLNEVKRKIYNTENEKNVNERMGQFYFDNTESVESFNYYLKILYYILIGISVFLFIFKKQYKNFKMYVFFVTILIFPYLLNKYYTFVMGLFRHFKLDNFYFIFLVTVLSAISVLNFTSKLPFI